MAFPQVATTSNGVGTGTSTVITMPAGATTGDLVMVFFAKDGTGTTSVSSGTGWTKGSEATDGSAALAVWWKVLTGSGDNLTLAHASEITAYVVYRITGFDSGTNPEFGTSATGAGNVPDPPSLTPSWGAADTLWIATSGCDGGKTYTAYPTNYASNQVTRSDTAAGGCGSAAATRELNTTSQDPSTFSISVSDGWIAQTVAIRPAAVAGQTAQYGVAAETDSALSFGTTKRASYGVAAEIDSALSFIRNRDLFYGIAAEIDSAFALVTKITSYGSLGSATNKTLSSSLAMNVSRDVPAGRMVVVYLAINGDEISGCSLSDVRGNTWTKLDEGWGYDATFTVEKAGGATFVSLITNPLTSGDAITATFTQNSLAKAITAHDWFGITPTDWLDSSGFLDIDTSPHTQGSIFGDWRPHAAEALVLTRLTIAGPNTDGFTPDTDSDGGDTWHDSTIVGTTGGANADNISIRYAWKITTSQAVQFWDPHLTATRSWLTHAVAFIRPATVVGSFGLASETDSALAFTGQIGGGGQEVSYGVAAETDGALAFIHSRVATYGIAAEVDSALAVTHSKFARYGIATETDSALAWTGQVAGAQQVFYGLAIETDSALAFTHSRVARFGVAAELDTALSFTGQIASSIVLAPFAILGDTTRPEPWTSTERPDRWDVSERPLRYGETARGDRWDATERPARWMDSVRPEHMLDLERPSFWAETIFVREDRDVALTIVAYGPFTENEVPEALLIRVMKPLKAGGTAPMNLYNQVPPYTATVSIKDPAAVVVSRAAEIMNPANLPIDYPDDFAASEQGWVRVAWAPTDFDGGVGEYEIQVTLDNGTVVLKSTEVWTAEVNAGPASAVT